MRDDKDLYNSDSDDGWSDDDWDSGDDLNSNKDNKKKFTLQDMQDLGRGFGGNTPNENKDPNMMARLKIKLNPQKKLDNNSPVNIMIIERSIGLNVISGFTRN